MEYRCRLKAILAERKTNLGIFADRVKISKAALSLIVNDKSLPSFPVLYRICDELDMDFREIWVKD